MSIRLQSFRVTRLLISLCMISMLDYEILEAQSPKPKQDSLSSELTSERTNSSKRVELKQIEIPFREHGYKHFDSCLIDTATELQSFLETVAEQPYWNKKEEFIEAINKFKLDFKTESLLLVRDTEGSGSVQVWLQSPMLLNRELVIRIGRKKPEFGTMDMAYYCFAIVVPRGIADKVKIFGSLTSSRSILGKDGKYQYRQGHSKDIELILPDK